MVYLSATFVRRALTRPNAVHWRPPNSTLSLVYVALVALLLYYLGAIDYARHAFLKYGQQVYSYFCFWFWSCSTWLLQLSSDKLKGPLRIRNYSIVKSPTRLSDDMMQRVIRSRWIQGAQNCAGWRSSKGSKVDLHWLKRFGRQFYHKID